MGQVKLAFKDTQGHKVIVTRSVQVTVQKNSDVKMKTLDGNLVIEKGGQRNSVSTKVAQINEYMLEFLGVSPAILDNVIFCHQDDSLWPMSEPLALKKKFDDIFDASKYTKVVDNLKIMRKKYMADLALLKQTEETEKINKEKGERLRKKADALEKVTDDLHRQLEEIRETIKVAAAEKMEKRIEANKASTAVEDLKAKTREAEFIRRNIGVLKSQMEELMESDGWLESTIAQYDERLAQYNEQQADVTEQFHALKESEKDLTRQMSQKQTEQGQHQAQKESHERHLERRGQFVREAARHHGIRGYDGDLDSDQIQDFLSRIGKASRDKDREFERIRKAASDEATEAQAVITNLEQNRNSQTQDRLYSQQNIKKNSDEIARKQTSMESIKMDEGAKAALESLREEAAERLLRMDTDYEAAAWDQNLKKEGLRLVELKGERSRLDDEITQITTQSSARAQLDLARKNTKQQQSSLDTMKAAHAGELASLVGADWQADTLEREFRAVVSQRAREVADATKQHEGVKDEYNRAEFELKAARADSKKKMVEMQSCEAIVLASIFVGEEEKPLPSVDDYQTELKNLEDDREDLKTQLDGAGFSKDYFNNCLSYANQKNGCKLCARGFASDTERSKAVDRLNGLLAKSANEEYQKTLDVLEQDLKKAHSARSQYDTFNTIKAGLPSVEKNLQKLEARKASALARLEKHDSLLNEADSAKRDAEALSETVRTISRCVSEIAKHEADVARLSSQSLFSGGSRSMDEINQQKAACDDQIRTVEVKIQKVTADKYQAQTSRSDLQREVESLSSRLSSAKHELEKKHVLQTTMEELRDSNSQLREAIRKIDAELKILGPKIEAATAQLQKVQERGRAKETEAQNDKSALSATVNKLTDVEDDINRYIEAGGPTKLASCQRSIKALEQEQGRTETEIAKVTKEANKLKAILDDSDKTLNNMKRNVQYRQDSRELAELQKEVAELQSRNVADDWEELEKAAGKAEQEYQLLVGQTGPIAGQIQSKDAELAGYFKEWETDYEHAASNYRKAQVKLLATKSVTDDVAKLTKAVDSAIMKYHTLKMEEINAIAADLWQKTYQGTDIDTIMIRSEDDESRAGSARATYKYRVVMVKQDTEMDMRGRCSAGQKVLACIIIRLALAECFGVNCGVSDSQPMFTTFLLTKPSDHRP